MAMLSQMGADLNLPDVGDAQYMLDAMFRLRPVRGNGMADVPADWRQIMDFAAATNRISEPWEIEAMEAMCFAYAINRQNGTNPQAIAPVDE